MSTVRTAMKLADSSAWVRCLGRRGSHEGVADSATALERSGGLVPGDVFVFGGNHGGARALAAARSRIDHESQGGRMRTAMIAGAVLVAMIAWTGSASSADAPKVYVGLFRDDAVAVIDSATNRMVRTIPVPK